MAVTPVSLAVHVVELMSLQVSLFELVWVQPHPVVTFFFQSEHPSSKPQHLNYRENFACEIYFPCTLLSTYMKRVEDEPIQQKNLKTTNFLEDITLGKNVTYIFRRARFEAVPTRDF